MHNQQSVEETKAIAPRRADEPRKPDVKNVKHARTYIDSLLEDPDDPMICRGID
jgi:hypothetical protein